MSASIIMAFVFLGGTCNGSTWRDELIPLLKCSYFNPVVEDWTPECIEEEYRQKKSAGIELYVITPEATGCFSIAELISASFITRAMCALLGNWESEEDKRRYRSFDECMKLAESRGAIRCYSIEEIAQKLNEWTT